MPGDSFNILAMSGGGARIIYMARILDLLAKHTGASITDFDIVAMNSASTALGMGLSVPDPDDPARPRYSPEDAMQIAREITPQILTPSFGRVARGKTPCSTTQMETILRDNLFGNTRLDQAVTRHLFSIHKNDKPMLMTNFHSSGLVNMTEASFAYAGDLPMAKASSAAMALKPMFGAVVDTDGGKLSDGGKDIPFPAMEARQSAKHLMLNGEAAHPVTGHVPNQTALFGLTNGYEHKQGFYKVHFSGSGPLKREIDMIERENGIMTDLEAIVVHDELNNIQIPADHHLFERCRSLSRRITESLFDTSPKNMEAMEDAAEIVFEHHLAEFERVGEILRQSRQQRQGFSP